MIFTLLRRRQWHPTAVLLPGKSHGWRSLEGCSLWGHWGSDTTERLHFHFSLSCIGEGNGNHSSVLAWRIPGTGEPGGLPSMGSHRVGHDWSDLAAAANSENLTHHDPFKLALTHFWKMSHTANTRWEVAHKSYSEKIMMRFSKLATMSLAQN